MTTIIVGSYLLLLACAYALMSGAHVLNNGDEE